MAVITGNRPNTGLSYLSLRSNHWVCASCCALNKGQCQPGRTSVSCHALSADASKPPSPKEFILGLWQPLRRAILVNSANVSQ